jgi:Protein kinase domain
MQFAAGSTVGPWTLVRFLGEGGNAEVWACRRDGEPERAVKILRDRRPDAVSYQRFRREIETHRQIGSRPDLLPMIDWHLPDEPTRRNRAWMSMPIAEPVREALSSAPLETVVKAVAAFAQTLAELQESYGIAHRDVKPGNLYRHEDAWAVGDLGLIDLPGADSLTETDRIVGPANFVAYEMMTSAATADPHLADVYSLAKTLWVLATGQVWPPPGHQPQGDGLQAIGAYRAHARTADLDGLIDLSTRAPQERPLLARFAAELRAWLDEPTMAEEGDLNLGDVAARIRAQLAPEIARQELSQKRREAAWQDAAQLGELLEPLIEAVGDAAPNMERGPGIEMVQALLLPPPTIGAPTVDQQWLYGARVVGPGPLPIAFDLMAVVAALDNGLEHIAGALIVKRERVLGTGFMTRYGPWQVMPGSLEARQAIRSLIDEMSNDLPAALQAFADALGGADTG